jgi:hypothetical protein
MFQTSFGAIAVPFTVFAAVFPTPVTADDGRCQQLEALHAQYAGVSLTPDQQAMKRKMTAWYYGHCDGRHAALMKTN